MQFIGNYELEPFCWELYRTRSGFLCHLWKAGKKVVSFRRASREGIERTIRNIWKEAKKWD